MTRFHHAYNGIPTVDRKLADHFDADTFGYRSLDYIARDRLSGSIDVEIRTMTPTLPGFKTQGGALAVPSASGNLNGARSIQDAFIPATALKGMLSSAYEAVTLSRLRIFDTQHTRTFSHRPPARKAQSTYPAFLTHNGHSWELVFPFTKDHIPTCLERWTSRSVICFIDSTAGKDGYTDIDALRKEFPHLTEVRYRAAEENIQKDAKRLIATHVQKFEGEVRGPTRTLNKNTENTEPPRLRGFIVRTRHDENQPIDSKRKRYEFIFPFLDRINERSAYKRQLDGTLVKQFISTLHDYAQNCLSEAQRLGYASPANSLEEQLNAGRSALQNTPRFIHDYLKPKLTRGLTPSEIDITDDAIVSYLRTAITETRLNGIPGIPVFVSLDPNQNADELKVSSIRLSPVGRMIGKDSVSAYKLAKDQNIDPASSLDTTSPGDSLWGFVPQPPSGDLSPTGGLQGRIAIESAYFVDSQSTSSDSHTSFLRIHEPAYFLTLASPKPRTGVPYLRDSSGRNLERKNPESSRKTPIPRDHTFIAGQTLTHKVYPTHQQLIKKQVDLPISTAETPMTSKITSWIEPGAVFHSRIRFTNLSNQELSILLWLLTPTMLAEGIKKIEEGYHHIGFGKPIGMGSVRIDATSCHVLTGKELATQYEALDSVCGLFNPIRLINGDLKKVKPINIQGHINTFLPEGFKESLPVKCFRRQACGWNDNVPVSYPTIEQEGRQSEDVSDNPTLTWFRKREDNRVKLASLYDHANAEPKQIEDAESQFGRYSFPTLDE